jgi:hypothetical protein
LKPGGETHTKNLLVLLLPLLGSAVERIKLLPRGCKNAITPAGKCFYE